MSDPPKDGSAPDFSEATMPEAVIERMADRFRLLADPSRLRLINALYVEGELTVGELVARGKTSYGAVSKQLSLLRAKGMVARRRDGTRVYYRIDDPTLVDLCDAAGRGVHADWRRQADALAG